MPKMEHLISLGILLIVIGFITLFFGIVQSAKEQSSKAKVAVGGFIGPIPFGFGTDKALLLFVTVLSIALFFVWLFFALRFRIS